MYEDTYRLRQFNEIKMQQEQQAIQVVRKCLSESNEQTNKMKNLLNNFESRLTALHDLIMPVYDATNTLQIKYSNLQKTVGQLDSIIEYYDSVKTLSLVIQAGPGKDINTYITHLNKLRLAIEYFDKIKNQSQKNQNEELWMQGKLNVDREFDLLLNKFSDNVFDFESDSRIINDSIISNSKDNDLKQMVNIIEWFRKVEPTYLDKLYEKIIRVRSQLILDALKKIKEKGNTLTTSNTMNNLSGNNLNNLNSSNKRTSLTPMSPNSNSSTTTVHDVDKRNSLRSRLTENLFSSSSDMRRKPTRNGTQNLNDSINNSNNSSTFINVNSSGLKEIHDFETTDCIKFIQCAQKVSELFKIENKFIAKVIQNNDSSKIIASKIIDRIFDPVLKFLANDAEKLAANVKQITSKCTSKFIIAMFSVLSDLVDMKQNFLKVFEQYTLNTKTTRYLSNSTQHFLEIFIIIEKACVQSLKDIIEEIKQDPQTIQPNGNIHPITTETITFIENLLPFDTIAGIIANVIVGENQNQLLPSEIEIHLRREASSQDNSNAGFTKIAYRENVNEKLIFRSALAEYFYKLLRWLNLNLKNKAENYEDQNLKWIFLLNNAFKISKLFTDTNNPNLKQKIVNDGHKCNNLNELFILSGKRDLKTFYDNEILTYKREYSKCWSRLLAYIRDLNEANPFTDLKLRDKDRQLLKDRFSGFNKEFEEIYEAQKKYYIPAEQAELAKMLREDNTLYIIGQYRRFYDVYGSINFATNKNKYVKYEPDELGARIREFFTAY